MMKIRVVSWNLNSGIFLQEAASSSMGEDGASYVVRCIKRLEPDIVAFQEILFPEQKESLAQSHLIAAEAGFPYIAQWYLSPSHLVEGAGLGLAVLSKFPVVAQHKILLPNPAMELRQGDGSVQRSHDKGLLNVKLSSPAGEIWFVCGHFPPFHRFNRKPDEPEFANLWSVADERLLELISSPVVGGIDFNTDQISTLLPRSFASGLFQSLIDQPTRPTGERHDQIVCTKEWSDPTVKVLTSRFDHHLCLADMALQPKRAEAKDLPKDRPAYSTLFLHLSDLHFGEGTEEDVDWKTFIAFATRETRRDRFVQFIRALPRVPDYVIVTGDLTIAGRENGYQSFVETMDGLIEEGFLPGATRIVVVPGNHDVVRLKDSSGSERERWDLFIKYIGGRFVRPWIRSHDPEPSRILDKLDELIDRGDEIWGGVGHEMDDRHGISRAWSLPFLWDRPRGVLIYTFNSASISGSRIMIPTDVEETKRWLRDLEGPNQKKVQKVLDAFDRELWVDPARVDPQEIGLFTDIMDRLSQKASTELETSLKIAVLHHHVTPVLREEVTKFELLLNAGRFKRELRDEGFQVILHGHKHWPEVLRDAARLEEEPQYVVSGGTIGGGQASGRRPGFFLLEHHSKEQTLSARYVVLKEAGNPRRSMGQDSVVSLRLTAPAKSGDLQVPPSLMPIRLPEILQSTERALLSCLRSQSLGQGREAIGWSHTLDDHRVSMIATAYGLRILALTRTGASVSSKGIPGVPRILDSLLALRNHDGGWSASSQSGTRSHPEPTAFALWALHAWNCGDVVQGGKVALERLLDPASDPIFWQHVYPVATVGRILAETDPLSQWLPRLSSVLSDAAYTNGRGRIRYWSRQMLHDADAEFGWNATLGSVIHTAHAVYTLCRMHRATLGRVGVAPEDLQFACEWLLLQEWSNTAEDINRSLEYGKYDKLAVKHFVSPWVVLALLEAGCSPDHPRIRGAVKDLLLSQQNGLWNWGLQQRPIWATHDALQALISFSMVASKV